MRVLSTSSIGLIRVLVLAGGGIVGVLALGGCGDASAQSGATRATSSGAKPGEALLGHVGKDVKVHLKRDALGVASPTGVGPLVDSMNRVELSLEGKLLGVNDQWVHLEQREELPPGRDNNGVEYPREYRTIVFLARDSVLAIITARELRDY